MIGFILVLQFFSVQLTGHTFDGKPTPKKANNGCADSGSENVTSFADAEELRLVKLINAHRARHKLTQLKPSRCLTAVSRWLSEDMSEKNYLSHRDSQGREWNKRLKDFNITNATGENIAAGYETANRIFLMWKKSPLHNQNMLSPKSKLIGVARSHYAKSRYEFYWTANFGK